MSGRRQEIEDLRVDHLDVRFPVGRHGLFNRRSAQWLHAVNDVSIIIPAGSALGIVGESGCGKSTLARTIAGLTAPTSGEVMLGNQSLGVRRSRPVARRVQMVFQDPASSLNPRMTVRAMLSEVLRVHGMTRREELEARLVEMLRVVELPERTLDQKPRNLSGGQRQRVGIARALAPDPDVLILDEAISALDVSVQAAVLALLRSLRAQIGLSMIVISHDLGAIRTICDWVAVMYLGRVVEQGPVDDVLSNPRHPYTRALLDAEPRLDNPRTPGAAAVKGEPPSAINIPSGCAFRPRCPQSQDRCSEDVPPIDTTAPRDQACFFPLDVEPHTIQAPTTSRQDQG